MLFVRRFVLLILLGLLAVVALNVLAPATHAAGF
jgi:hypothetical protein